MQFDMLAVSCVNWASLFWRCLRAGWGCQWNINYKYSVNLLTGKGYSLQLHPNFTSASTDQNLSRWGSIQLLPSLLRVLFQYILPKHGRSSSRITALKPQSIVKNWQTWKTIFVVRLDRLEEW